MGFDPAITILRLDSRDTVGVSLRDLGPGCTVDGVLVHEPIPVGHKIALAGIGAGGPVIKSGAIIGYAIADIVAGSHVHAGTVRSGPAGAEPIQTSVALAPAEAATFEGFVREDGRVGTRNTIGLFVVGNCGATAARKAADWFDADRLADYPNVDAVVPYIHELGCGMEMTGEPMDLLRRTISGTIRNPNTAGAVVVALGCERNNLRSFLEQELLVVGERLQTVTIQEVGGIAAAVSTARRMVEAMLPAANLARRQTVSAAHLVLGLKSSASDGFSGVSANPVLGIAVDLLVQAGGTAILAETPEILGVEQALLARAATPAIAASLSERLDWWRQYSAGKDTQFNGRVNRANEAAGLLNIHEKAMDGVKKAGQGPIAAVVRYAETVTARGLVFMDTPGYDPVSVTGQIAGGATLIALTTGQGSVFGSLPAPTVKLASNSATFARMADDTDIDCGAVLDGGVSVEAMGREVFAQLLRHASGEKTKAEIDGMGENEFVPWPIGVLA